MSWEDEAVAVEGIHPRYGDGKSAPEEVEDSKAALGSAMLTLAFGLGLVVGFLLGRL